jgi:hypothetical protein
LTGAKSDRPADIGRLLAFGLVIAGAALVPAPLRATSNHPAQQTVTS